MGVTNWLQYKKKDGSVATEWVNSVKGQKSADTYAKKQGGSNAKYIGKTGTVVSNTNGYQQWALKDKSATETPFNFKAKQDVPTPEQSSNEPSTAKTNESKTSEKSNENIEHAKLAVETTKETAGFAIEKGFDAASKIQPEVEIFEQGAKVAESGSEILGGAAVLLTVADAINEGKWQTKHTIDAGMGIIGTACPLIGVLWLGANLVNMAINHGESISQTIQRHIDN